MSVGDPLRNPVELVISADNMDTATFAKHMTYRHLDSLGGLTELEFRGREHLAQNWRVFHRRLHEVRLDLNHEHAEFRPASPSAQQRSGVTRIG